MRRCALLDRPFSQCVPSFLNVIFGNTDTFVLKRSLSVHLYCMMVCFVYTYTVCWFFNCWLKNNVAHERSGVDLQADSMLQMQTVNFLSLYKITGITHWERMILEIECMAWYVIVECLILFIKIYHCSRILVAYMKCCVSLRTCLMSLLSAKNLLSITLCFICKSTHYLTLLLQRHTKAAKVADPLASRFELIMWSSLFVCLFLYWQYHLVSRQLL